MEDIIKEEGMKREDKKDINDNLKKEDILDAMGIQVEGKHKAKDNKMESFREGISFIVTKIKHKCFGLEKLEGFKIDSLEYLSIEQKKVHDINSIN